MKFVRAAAVVTVPIVLVVAAVSTVHAQAPANVVSLKVSREAAPPGAIAQMKVFITEPKPITSGLAFMDFAAFEDVVGIALASGESAAVAVAQGGQIALSIVSPGATFGMDPDYPVLTIAGRVPTTAPIGLRIPMTIDPGALQLLDPAGNLYATEVRDGYLLTGGTLSISNVVPGSAELDTGGVVSIFGSGFRPGSKVRVKETPLAGVRYISPNRIDVVVGQPTRMHGREIRVKNRDGEEATYFSYQRTRRSGTTEDLRLQNVVPIFGGAGSDRHVIDTSASTAGVALQNLDGTGTSVYAELFDASGTPLAAGYVEIPSASYVVRSLAEIFGFSPAGPATITIAAVSPVQALAVDVDWQGRATPRLPR